jgi:hypothetical protein
MNSSILAALAGFLQGGGQAWQQQQQNDRQKRLDDARIAQEQAQALHQQQEYERQQTADKARVFEAGQKDTGAAIDRAGPWGGVQPNVEADARKYGLADRLQQTPDLTHSLFEGMPTAGLPNVLSQAMGVPNDAPTRTTVRPTGAQMGARDAADAEQQRLQTTRAGIADPNEQKVFDANPQAYKPTVQSFMDSAARLAKEKDAAQQALDAKVAEQKTLGPLRTDEEVRGAGLKVPIALKQARGEAQIRQDAMAPPAAANGAVDPYIQGVAEGRIQPPSPRAANYRAVMEAVTQYKPDFTGQEYVVRQRMRQGFTSGTQSQSLNSLNTAIEHLDQLAGDAENLGNGSALPWNRMSNWLRKQSGDSAITNFEGMQTIMSGELASAFKKSGATDTEIKEVKAAISSASSPQQLSDYIKHDALPALASKARTYGDQYRGVFADDTKWSPYTPGARRILQKYSIDTGDAGAPASGTGAAPPPRNGAKVMRFDAQGNLLP